MTSTTHPTFRKASLPQLVDTLRALHAQQHDVVVPAGRLTVNDDGLLVIADGGPAVLGDDGVTNPTISLDWLNTAEESAADRLGIPLTYWRKCPPALVAANVNHWLSVDPARKFLIRTLLDATLADGPTDGVVRSVLSDGYRIIDNLDGTMAVLEGVRAAGVDPAQCRIDADLTTRRLTMRLTAPVTVDAGDLVEGYRGPGGRTGRDYPLVAAGLLFQNSETGAGAYTITPRAEFLVCTNGMTRTKDSVRVVHIGGRLPEGQVVWSQDTQQAQLDLIRTSTRDAVAAFLRPSFVEQWVDEMREARGIVVDRPAAAIEHVAKTLGFSEQQQDELLGAFMAGGDSTAFGLAQAVTAWARDTDDDELSAMAEASAFDAAMGAARR